MKKEVFLLEDKKKEIESKFIENGWTIIYDSFLNDTDDFGIYCCLVHCDKIDEIRETHSWPFTMGCEGKPTVYGDYSYNTYNKEGIEPFIFYRSFPLYENNESYFDISEEFIFYFNLYEKAQNKKNRKYYYIDNLGNLDEVIIIEPKSIRIKLKYLKEYISIRDMYFILCFDFMRLVEGIPLEWGITNINELVKNGNHIYRHMIREVLDKTQSWIMGKAFIEPNKTKSTHFDNGEEKYESFITGFDEEGKEILEDCKDTNEKSFKVTYFRKEVLDKYYNNPIKYNVNAFNIYSKYFTLKIDNNIEDYVPVFLVELSSLPYKEQLHWKQYNISPQNGMRISSTYFRTMILGKWAESPETPDLFFKYKYEDFNKKWEEKFGWKFYKSLAKEDEHLYVSLHLPTSNNVKSFCEQILTVVKLTIDRLNEKKFKKGTPLQEGDKGLTKLEKYLKVNGLENPKMFEFLRNLQSLRSGLIAHTFSNSNKDCKKAIVYFGLKDDNYKEVAKDIFVKSINTLNTLEKAFL